jgi:hypothetical protein
MADSGRKGDAGDNAWDQRTHPRRHCRESTFYATSGSLYEGLIENIGLKGVYIRSVQPIEVGEIITVAVPTTTSDRGVKLRGEIVWKNARGFGVDFKKELNE